MKEKLKSSISKSSIIFTLIISLSYLIGALASNASALFVPTPARAFMILLFSFIIGFADLIICGGNIKPARAAVHFIVCLISFILLIIVPSDIKLTGPVSVILSIAFVFLYFILLFIRYVIYKKSVSGKEEAEYKSVFGGK